MMKNVLIATLGESPAVVTEALDVLKNRRIPIHEVVLLTTIDSAAEESLNLLTGHLSAAGIGVHPVQVEAYKDIDTDEAVMEFMEVACNQLRDMQKRGWNVYVSVAGGRKTMSALMTLAVQIYGAKELFHIIVDDPDLEEKSRIENLMHYSKEEQEELLHPDISKIKFVSMPFIGLFPWISDIVKALKGEATDRKEIKELLSSNGLIEDNKPTSLGKRFLDILGRVESMPDPCPEEPEIKLSRKEPKYKEDIEKMANKIKRRFSFVCEIRDADWRRGEPKVKVEHPDRIKVYFPSGKGYNLSLILRTTAKTRGQLEAAKSEVERFMEREKL